MSFYRWMIEHGAGVLFASSVLIFAISLAGVFGVPANFVPSPAAPGESVERLWSIVSAVGTAVSHSALTFFGACFLHRIDARWIGGATK